MHGLIFETSVWLLAGSTRFLFIYHHWGRLCLRGVTTSQCVFIVKWRRGNTSSVFDHAGLYHRWNSPLLDSITWCEKSSTTTWQCRTRFNSSLICPVSLLGFPQQLSQVNRVSDTWVNKVTPIHAGECCVQGHTSDYNRQLLFNLESTHMGLCECFIAHFYS